ncbi:MAG: hypothetical protein R3Y13_05330 [bacterium]
MLNKRIIVVVSLLFLTLFFVVYFFILPKNNTCIGCRANTPCAEAYDCEPFSDNTLKCTYVNNYNSEETIICDVVNED